ncbi:MAG: c-type cytochrome [Candidatus Neomarinimicrobiota bacterium]
MNKKIGFAGLLVLTGCATLIPLKVGPPIDITVEITPERGAKGEYLVNNVTHCLHCHSELDQNYYSFPPVPGTEGAGGFVIEEAFGMVQVPNITPHALGDWTDGELIQAITEGVNRERKPLFPIMPYDRLRYLDREDLSCIVAYIRTLKPIKNAVSGKKKLKFPLQYIERTFPHPYDPLTRPDPSDVVAYGKYMTIISNCEVCHTPTDKMGRPLEGMYMAGGQEFLLPGGSVILTANVTPDQETGIGNRSKENFIGLFKAFQTPVEVPEDKKHENTLMPWFAYTNMTEEDLGAIYEYLMTLEPVNNSVVKYPTASE